MSDTPPPLTDQQHTNTMARDLVNARVSLMMFRQACGSAMGQISEAIQQIGRGTAPLQKARAEAADYRARWESTVREARRQHAEVDRLRAELTAAGAQIHRIAAQSVAEDARLRAERDQARADAFREVARLLEATGRDDDAVNLLDNIADGITTHATEES